MPDQNVAGILFDDADSDGRGQMKFFGPGSIGPAWFCLPLIAGGGALMYAAFHHCFFRDLPACFWGL